jgi:hypothetical protein
LRSKPCRRDPADGPVAYHRLVFRRHKKILVKGANISPPLPCG